MNHIVATQPKMSLTCNSFLQNSITECTPPVKKTAPTESNLNTLTVPSEVDTASNLSMEENIKASAYEYHHAVLYPNIDNSTIIHKKVYASDSDTWKPTATPWHNNLDSVNQPLQRHNIERNPVHRCEQAEINIHSSLTSSSTYGTQSVHIDADTAG